MYHNVSIVFIVEVNRLEFLSRSFIFYLQGSFGRLNAPRLCIRFPKFTFTTAFMLPLLLPSLCSLLTTAFMPETETRTNLYVKIGDCERSEKSPCRQQVNNDSLIMDHYETLCEPSENMPFY